MEFDTFVVARLMTGPTPPQFTEQQGREAQDAHLAHIADMWASGKLIAAGPASGPEGLRGFSIFIGSLEDARALADSDPSVLNGTFVNEYAVWRAPPGHPARLGRRSHALTRLRRRSVPLPSGAADSRMGP
jgi:uncharacterized protein YciI